jgi:hypothetical protein
MALETLVTDRVRKLVLMVAGSFARATVRNGGREPSLDSRNNLGPQVEQRPAGRTSSGWVEFPKSAASGPGTPRGLSPHTPSLRVREACLVPGAVVEVRPRDPAKGGLVLGPSTHALAA